MHYVEGHIEIAFERIGRLKRTMGPGPISQSEASVKRPELIRAVSGFKRVPNGPWEKGA